MRFLILSDIHANLEALEAVLRDANGAYDEIVNCGDLVGYGPDPNAVVSWCRENTPAVVRGNHDKACATLNGLEWFNPVAQESTVWTNNQLSEENLEYLRALPAGPRAAHGFQIFHGSPADEDEYLVNVPDIEYAANFLARAVSFFGHTHLQGGFEVHRNGVVRLDAADIAVEETSAYLINSGSVGQPRDRDPRAAYAIYRPEDRTVELRRAEYDVERTMNKILAAGLPEPLATRLRAGY